MSPLRTRRPRADRFDGIDELLIASRRHLDRLTPIDAAARVAEGSRFVDIRPAWQRAADGEIPGSLIVERNHLEWRLHPGSGAALPDADLETEWIVVCTEGYSSSLAAASLNSIGLRATDLVGGILGWAAAGFAIAPGPSDVETVVPTTGVP